MDGSSVYARTGYAVDTHSYAYSPRLRIVSDDVILPQRSQ
jgi:hypothetical protein